MFKRNDFTFYGSVVRRIIYLDDEREILMELDVRNANGAYQFINVKNYEERKFCMDGKAINGIFKKETGKYDMMFQDGTKITIEADKCIPCLEEAY